MTLAWADKLLPNQPHQLEHFKETSGNPMAAIANLCGAFAPDGAGRFTLTPNVPGLATVTEMASHPVTLATLGMLIKLFNPTSILEIGAFVGLGTMTMAAEAAVSAKITTIEPYALAASTARENFSLNGFSEQQIKLVEKDALELFRGTVAMSWEDGWFDKHFDFVYIDGGKQNYARYLFLMQPFLSRQRHILVIDDVFFNGDALNETPTTDKGHGAKAALEWAQAHSEYRSTLLPIGNGLLIMLYGF